MSILRVLPDSERVEAAMLEAAQATGFVEGTSFLSFGELVESLEGARRLKPRPCSGLTARIVLWAVARDLKPNPFGNFVHEPAFARAALDLVLDLKAGMLSPTAFAEAVRGLGPARQGRARALAELYEAYETRMFKLGLADREDAVKGGLERLRADGLPEGMLRFEGLSLEGIYDFPPSRVALLVALAEACAARGKTLRLQLPGAGAAAVDAAVDGVLAELERRHAQLPNVEAHKSDAVGAGRPLGRLAAALFSDSPPLAEPADLQLRALPSARAEARELARVARTHVDRGVAPERIALCYRELGEEAEWLEEALAEMGVAARIRRGAPVNATAVGRLVLDLPRLVDDAFPAGEVARVLTHRYARAVSRPLLDAPSRWLTAASVRDERLGAEPPRGAYEVRLSALAERLQTRDPIGAGQVRELLDRCKKLFAIVGKIPEHAKALELLDRWWTCVGELGVLDAVRQPEQRDMEGTPFGVAILRALARDQAAADALREMTAELDAALRLSGAGMERMHRRTFHRWLLDAARDFDLSMAGPRAGAVRVLDVRELPAREFDVVCVGGLVDGRFPARELPHALFSEDDRRAVNRWVKRDVFRVAGGEAGARAPWRLAEDRLLFHAALTASTGPVVLSYARTGPSGAAQIPSYFLDELARLSGRAIESRPLAPICSLADAETELELRSRASLELFAPAALRTTDPEASAVQVRGVLGSEPWALKASALVDIELERLRFFSDPTRGPGRFSGAVEAEALLPAVREAFAFGASHPLDSTSLGHFGNCAFQGFLHYILRLREPEEPGEELDSRGQGNFWHGVLEHLFPLLRERNLLGRPVEEVPEALIDTALEAAIAEAEADQHVGHPVLWRLGRERARAMVRRLLATDHHGLPFDGERPERVELRFGTSHSPEGWRHVALALSKGAPVHLKGSIDRFDRGAAAAAVIDYKAGTLNPTRLKEELLTTQFQIPVYAYALRQSGYRGDADGAWLSLRDGTPMKLSGLLDGQTVDELLAVDPVQREALAQAGKKNLANAVEPVINGLRAGQFGARPHDCEWCAFRALCRISDRRIEERFGG